MTRSIQEVFGSHRKAIESLDFENLAADYAEDAVLITIDGAFVGREAIMNDFFKPSLSRFTNVRFDFEKTVFDTDLCLLQWSAEMEGASIPRGTAVFLIRDGLIQRQGEWFEIVVKE